MPYASDAQRRFFHTKTARSKGISAATVEEYDEASKGMKLPERREKKTPHERAVHGFAKAAGIGRGKR